MFIIFGCKELGRKAVRGLRAAGVEPLAYCDNNTSLWGETLDGLTILPPLAAREQFPTATYVVAIFNPARVTQQLSELRLKSISYDSLLEPYNFSAEDRFTRLTWESFLKATDTLELLADDYSRRELSSLTSWLRYRFPATGLCSGPKDIYFPKHIYRIGQDEVFVDCGAFDGDTFFQFSEAVDGDYNKAYLIEPDPANAHKLKRMACGGKVDVIPSAVSNHCGKVTFDSAGTAGSSITDSGSIEVDCTTLDALFADSSVAPTIVKMDVEGHELEVLEGAKETIRKHQPVLAVCAYHKPDHLWQIPQLIHQLNPGYKIYLRRYAEDCWETVYYAVPPHRVMS